MCTSPLIREIIFDDKIPRVRCPKCDWIQLSSNTVGVLVIAKNKEEIVVIFPPDEDGIGIPAGLVEYAENPETAAVREVREETGLDVKITNCLGWFFLDRATFPGPAVQIVYEARIIGGTITGSDEGRAEIIPENNLPAFSSSRTGSQIAFQYFLSKAKGGYHSVHPTDGSRRVFKRFAQLEAMSDKIALSRPTHQRVTQALRQFVRILRRNFLEENR
jgi:8-oxo-dGTP diphosphatase